MRRASVLVVTVLALVGGLLGMHVPAPSMSAGHEPVTTAASTPAASAPAPCHPGGDSVPVLCQPGMLASVVLLESPTLGLAVDLAVSMVGGVRFSVHEAPHSPPSLLALSVNRR